MASEKTRTTFTALFQQHMKRWGIETAKQFFDINSPTVLDVFPNPASTPITEQYLAERVWWWRYADEQNFEQIFYRQGDKAYARILFDFFKDHFEPSAYYYELRARYDDRYEWEFGRPWIKCSQEQRRMLNCLWPNTRPAIHFGPANRNDPTFVTLPRTTFNLRLNDAVLTRQFIDEIARERRRLQIQNPGHAGGVRRRAFSWKPIEFLDTRHYQLRTLNEAERSQVSKAKHQYQEACVQVGVAP